MLSGSHIHANANTQDLRYSRFKLSTTNSLSMSTALSISTVGSLHIYTLKSSLVYSTLL